jgi:hypothetical protein
MNLDPIKKINVLSVWYNVRIIKTANIYFSLHVWNYNYLIYIFSTIDD